MWMLLLLSGSPSVISQESAYSPCNVYFDSEEERIIDCESQPARDILNAFQRNDPSRYIKSLLITNAMDMTDEIMDQILTLASNGSALTTVEIDLSQSHLKRVPQSIRKFRRLETLRLTLIPTLKVLTTRSVVLSSDVRHVSFASSGIRSIQPNAFQGITLKSERIN